MSNTKLDPQPAIRLLDTHMTFPTASDIARIAASLKDKQGRSLRIGQPFGVKKLRLSTQRSRWLLNMGYVKNGPTGELLVSSEPWSEKEGDCIVPNAIALDEEIRRLYSGQFYLETVWQTPLLKCDVHEEAPSWYEGSPSGLWKVRRTIE